MTPTTSTTQKKTEADKWQSSPEHGGEAFWGGDASTGCALRPGLSKQTRKVPCPQTVESGNWDFIILWNW